MGQQRGTPPLIGVGSEVEREESEEVKRRSIVF